MPYPRSVSDPESSNEYDSEEERLVEAFKSKNFKSDSSIMICPSKGKVTAHGIVSTPCDTYIGERNLKAVLVLPDLKERTSMSSMEGLYELSQRLAVTSPRLLSRKVVEDPKETLAQAQDTEGSTGQENDQQHEEVERQEMIQKPEVIAHNLTLKQRQRVPPGKVFTRLPIYASCSSILHRNKKRNKKKSRKNISKANFDAYISRKLKNHLGNHPATTEVRANKKEIKFLNKLVQSDTFKVILLLVLICVLFIMFYDIENSVEDAYFSAS
ncbi:uncharacterized protein LOC111070526 [Drosophila obscura]|uniref:uncharacterized protein LOC111070526 n=1 Tax=Drosophila obscura TaxID=7282 RepID=UPI000BA0024A|nr:uncharacterized protein LOC111070526 [Drosophila obscura]